MKAIRIFTITFIMLNNHVHSQIPVGLKYDLNAFAFNGYFDPFTYSPEKKLTILHNSDSYEIGYYYDSLSNKIHGKIKFENDNIKFKDEKSNVNTIKPDEINYFVIGVDSFFVVRNFYYRKRLITNPEFVQYITEFNDYTVAKHFKFTSSVSQQYAMQEPIIGTFLIKHKDSTIWDNFPDNSRFKENSLKYFGHIPYLKEKISSGKYNNDNIFSIVKMAEYYEKFKNSDLIYYDKYWQEVKNPSKAEYWGKISDRADSIWTVEYFNDSIKLYTANYSSFYPNNKNGKFILYFPTGEIRQITLYENDKPKEVKIFNKTDDLLLHYQYIENKKSTNKTDVDIKYISVVDSSGINMIESVKSFHELVSDDFAFVNYHHHFTDKELVSSYRLLNNDTIFQIINSDKSLNINALQKKLDYFFEDKEYYQALSENAQGIILVSFIINEKGVVVDYVILNKLHQELDRLVKSFILTHLYKNSEFKLKTDYKEKNQKYIEVVIPFEFVINRFYRKPATYNHYNYYNQSWHIQQQMQRQMQRQTIQNYRPPTF